MAVLFDTWRPNDEDHHASMVEGCLVAWEFKPWRVKKILERDRHDDDPEYVKTRTGLVLRPPEAEQWMTTFDGDVHLSAFGRKPLPVLREHYGLCVHCGELTPCREQELEWAVVREAQRMKRYDDPGVCPACREVVTERQQSQVQPNIVVPGGPPVVFHTGRQKCWVRFIEYRRKVVAAGEDSAKGENCNPG